VEAAAANALGGVQVLPQRIAIGGRSHGLMEGGIEDHDLGDTGKDRAAYFDARLPKGACPILLPCGSPFGQAEVVQNRSKRFRLSVIEEPLVIERILHHLGRWNARPPGQAPPQDDD